MRRKERLYGGVLFLITGCLLATVWLFPVGGAFSDATYLVHGLWGIYAFLALFSIGSLLAVFTACYFLFGSRGKG